jgi:hypothetical protein
MEIPICQKKRILYFQQSVGPGNVPGFREVEKLAHYLVDLRTETGISLSNQQANKIVQLWEGMDMYDQSRILYSARFQRNPNEGVLFRSPKRKSGVTPGAVSTTRLVAP